MAQKKAGCLNATLGCLGFIVLGAFVISVSIGLISDQNNAERQQLDVAMPSGTFERLKHDLSNKGELTRSGNALVLTFQAGEIMTTSTIQHKVTDSLRIIHDSGFDYSTVRFSALATLVDKFGNNSTAEVASLQYDRDTVDQINFDNFVAWDVFDIADYKRLHPAISE